MWHEIANGIGEDDWPDDDQFPKYFKKPKKALQMPRGENSKARYSGLQSPNSRRSSAASPGKYCPRRAMPRYRALSSPC